jgi:large subunit ribosomal protein L17
MRNMTVALLRHERVRTTIHKAKELRSYAERIITHAKKDTVAARRLVARDVQDREVARKLFEVLVPRYADRPGGYTRILRLGPRKGDNAEMAFLELVDADLAAASGAAPSKAGKKPRGRIGRVVDKVRGAKAEEAEAAEPDEAEAKPKKKAARKKTAKKKTAKKKTAKKKTAKAAPKKKAKAKTAAKKKTAKKKTAKAKAKSKTKSKSAG